MKAKTCNKGNDFIGLEVVLKDSRGLLLFGRVSMIIFNL
jgi:hypothetical protein